MEKSKKKNEKVDLDIVEQFGHTSDDLKKMQALDLDRKIKITQTRLLEWYQHWDGLCYISFSGGKDSTQQWLTYGCNAFDADRPRSNPVAFWTEQDVLVFIDKYKIPVSTIYGEIQKNPDGKYCNTGRDRTWCMFCGFGVHLEGEPNRYQQLKQTHPKIWEYCMKPIDEGRLGMREPLEFIGVKIE